MFYTIKKLSLTFMVFNLFMFQSLMADMLFYYSAAVLPAIISSGQQTDHVIADAGEDKTTVVNQAVTITGSGTDGDGSIVSYEWKKGNELLSTDATFSYTPTVVAIDILTLTVIDDDDNNDTDTMTVTVTDGTAPIITVTGTNPLTIDQDSTYVDDGATAIDDVDDTVTVIVTGAVDTSIVGEYIITYTAEDSAGNHAVPKTRTVRVVYVVPPVITITGNSTLSVEYGSTYTDAGATATDNVDVTVTVTPSGSVDTNTVAEYTITYNAADAAGNNAIPVERTVHVVDTIVPVFTSSATVTVDENQNAAITLVATDTNTLTYSITGGDATDFDINDTSGVVTFKIAPDYESGKTSYTFTATATDGASNAAEQSVVITINDISDTAPTLAATSLIVEENAVDGTIVGSVTIIDSGDTAITGFVLTGVGEGNFIIDIYGEIKVAEGATLDYETTPIYNLHAVATNDVGNSASVSITINVEEEVNPFQIAKIQASDGKDYIGSSVSISGDYIIVGSPDTDLSWYTTNVGSAYLYKKQIDGTLIEVAKIQASDREKNARFGSSVAISGDYIIIGTPGWGSGSAYLFKINSDTNITQIAKIQASDAENDDQFGSSVAINGDYIIIGAPYEDTTESNTGSAYVFKISDTSVVQIAKIQASDGGVFDYFGSSVAISEDYMAVGAPYNNSSGVDAGSAYLFKRISDTSIIQIANLGGVGYNDRLGIAVSINGNYIAANAVGASVGRTYLYKRNSDTVNDIERIAFFVTDDAEDGDSYYKSSISITENYIVVGVPYKEIEGQNKGSTYIFKRNSDTENDITQIARIQAHDTKVSGGYFGISVSIDADYIAVGTLAGSGYIFDMKPIKKPYIYNTPKSAINYNEQLLNTHVYSFESASPSSGIIEYTLSGTDANSFLFIDNNLSFDPKADFEFPEDSNINNDYNITVTATDINSNATEINIDISVKDKYYFDLAEIQASDAKDGDVFGWSVDMSGDYVVVGAVGENSAYLYKKQIDGTLIEIAKIQGSDSEAGDQFGYSVSIDGDYIVVGSSFDDRLGNKGGSAYLFKRNSDTTNDITQIAKMKADPSEYVDYFGRSVSISGDYIVVGGDEHDGVTSDNTYNGIGAAFVFKRDSDTSVRRLTKLKAHDPEYWDGFGVAVSISGDYIAVGAPFEDTTASGAGSTYIFKRNSDTNIAEIAKIQAENAGAGDYFGTSVSIDGDYIVVGAPYEDTTESNSGSAYVFKRNSDSINDVVEIAQIQGHDAQYNDNFGTSASIDGDYIAVGAPYEDTTATDSGSTYIFKRNSDGSNDVDEIAKIQAINTKTDDSFGRSVSASSNHIVVGTSKEGTGSAYLFIQDANQEE